MKKLNKRFLIISLVSILVIAILVIGIPKLLSPAEGILSIEEIDGQQTIVDDHGDIVQLRGMSTHGLQWYSSILNNNAFAALKNDWQANVVRLAVYVNENGYNKHPEAMMEKVTRGIDLAIANDLYVIVDWHVHYPGDPNDETYAGAMDFFNEVSSLYPNNKHIIYEIANEPNDRDEEGITNDMDGWRRVKAYAEPIIAMLRETDNENLVIVGTPSWSQRPDLAAEEPIEDNNTAYTVHFYSGTHNDGYVMGNAKKALKNDVAIFVTEFGTSEAGGYNGPYLEETDEWLNFLDENHVSWVNWSASIKQEASAAFIPYTNLDPGESQAWGEDVLTESGMYIRDRLRSYK
ncbi:glycoside hydrolase family 5 protein [Radiobacillus sp. PE A8.2]|uniref:glycoside hydrolase family 5 protein n=1 Tax=Radiobacillus sp. PE A8.2 TaxID=3380349 RepID=UPI00388F7057